MDFEVYCDESRPEIVFSRNGKDRFLLIGSLWMPARLRGEFKRDMHRIRDQWTTWGEIKWSKVSQSRLGFYQDLIDQFLAYGEEVRFRCIVVDGDQLDMDWHDGDAELGFYKFYYQLLHHWILDFNRYSIYCDTKTNRDPSRLRVLKDCLNNSNLSSEIGSIQALPSPQVAPMQLTDLLLGIVGARFNQSVKEGGCKDSLIKHLETRLGVDVIGPTSKGETKFNVFRIRLAGGW
ncbi:DUF3800 domain-containing protein [Kineobactrum sediminis]|uniref:DUF3800 domain-containing protein n=1 Tax=Kineobactrum sediminis TaxID=1905677 RepID=A0A2N5XYT7_9GAMM|nr:DUF3800 domain-containing protein [Kineobactrum sediminis]PLW81301.1 DUF3800 domain-containing protein [Kineobactrum sediminis]